MQATTIGQGASEREIGGGTKNANCWDDAIDGGGGTTSDCSLSRRCVTFAPEVATDCQMCEDTEMTSQARSTQVGQLYTAGIPTDLQYASARQEPNPCGSVTSELKTWHCVSASGRFANFATFTGTSGCTNPQWEARGG